VRPNARASARAKIASGKKGPDESGEWEVEAIVDDCIDRTTMQHQYLVKWKGFSAKDNTWEPKVNLARCSDLMAAYENRTAKKRGRAKK